MKDQLNPEEQEILEKFEQDELRPATDVDREMAIAPQAAPQHLQEDPASQSAGHGARLQSSARAGARGGAYPTRHCCRASSTNICRDG